MLAALLFATAGLLRQNGLILALPAALALAWATSAPGWARAVRTGVGWLASVGVLALILSIVAQPQGVGAPDGAGAKGIRLLQSYDLAAAAALQPGRAMPNIDRAAPLVGTYLRDNAARVYSPERVDTMTADPWLAKHLPSVSRATIQADWFGLITGDPGLYLRGRWLAFQQVLATPEIDRCLPVHVGVTGPAKALSDLKMARRADAQDGRIYNYVTWFLDTPAMSHLAYAALAICVFTLLMLRRDPAENLEAVESLLWVVLVEEDPLGVAGAADVDADCGVPVAGEPRVSHGVVDRSCIVLAVGEVLEDRGGGRGVGALRHPDTGGQARSVSERNPRMLDDSESARRSCGHHQTLAVSLARASRMLFSQSTRISGTDMSRFWV